MKKKIFGRIYSFDAEGKFRALVARSIDAYPDARDQIADVEIFAGGDLATNEPVTYQNPKILTQYRDSFVTDFGPLSIRWRKDTSRLLIHLVLREPLKMFTPRHRWRSMEFATLLDYFQQVLHELVLIPSVFFFTDQAPLHAAAVAVRGKAVLIAGTGGTGKTSALLSLREEEEVSFLSDDICVVSAQGRAFPNLSWPKIYGYNVADPGMRRLLLDGRGFIDKLHFAMRRRVNPARVRRKIQPGRLFRAFASNDVPLGAVVMLARSNVPSLTLEPLDTIKAVRMNLAVMQTEYFTFFRFLLWKEFNDLLVGEGSVTEAQILDAWRSVLGRAFGSCRILAVKIPLAMRHDEYIARIREIVLEEAVR